MGYKWFGRNCGVPIYDTRHFHGDTVEDLTRLQIGQRDLEPRTEHGKSQIGQTTSMYYTAVRTTVLVRFKKSLPSVE